MEDSRRPSPWSLGLALCLLAVGGTRAGADPYYNATDTSTLTPAQFALLFPTSPDVPLTDAQIQNLPGIYGILGASNPERVLFPMHAVASNGAGTVIGVVPSGDSRANPYSTPTVGYAQMQPDGTFGSFVPLSSDPTAVATVNSQNQILLFGSTVDQKIIDLNKGTTTEFASIVSPATLQQYGGWLYPEGIADNGAILARYYRSGTSTGYGTIILTPQDIPLPVPAPEPTALFTILAGLGAIAFRRHFYPTSSLTTRP